eukprot:5829524-Amphidinium_carterae.1
MSGTASSSPSADGGGGTSSISAGGRAFADAPPEGGEAEETAGPGAVELSTCWGTAPEGSSPASPDGPDDCDKRSCLGGSGSLSLVAGSRQSCPAGDHVLADSLSFPQAMEQR